MYLSYAHRLLMYINTWFSHCCSFHRKRTVNGIDYPGMWTIAGNESFFFFFLLKRQRDRFYWNFFILHKLFHKKTTLACKSFWDFNDLLNCSSLKCVTKKAWNFHEKGISILKTAAWSNQKMQLKVLASLFQIEVLIWSVFSNMFKDDQTVVFLIQFLSEFHWVVPFCSWLTFF